MFQQRNWLTDKLIAKNALHDTAVELPSLGSLLCVTREHGGSGFALSLPHSASSSSTAQVSKATQPFSFFFFSSRVTTAIHHTKNTLKETASTRHQCALIATSPALIWLFPPAPPSTDAPWENSTDNTVHAPKPCKSVRRKSVLIGVRLEKERERGRREWELEARGKIKIHLVW